MNTPKEKEIREKSELLEVSIGAERERYQGQGYLDLGKQHPERSIGIHEFQTRKSFWGPGGQLL